MPDFDILVSTGKYDRWPLVAADRKKYGADKVGTFSTEAGRFTDATLTATFGPDAVRGGTGGAEVVVTLPPGFSPAGEAYDHQLSDLTYSHDAAHGGKPYPPFAVLVRPAVHDETGVLVDFIGGHLALPNTPRRVEVSNDSLFGATGLTAFVSSIRAEGRHVVVGLDTNLAWKNPDDRALLQKVARATGCVWALDGRVPKTKRSLIDNVLTSLPVRSVRLIDPVRSSDHPWTAVGLSVPAPVVVAPRPVPVPAPAPEAPVSIKPLEVPFIAARWHGGAQTPKAVVIHGTVSPCKPGNARAVANFFRTHGQPTSAHYTVDPGEIIQSVGDHTVAYHCGYNTGSISFELSDPQTGPGSRWADDTHTKMLDLAAKSVAQTCLAYGIEMRRPSIDDLKRKGPHGIYSHDDSRRAFGKTTHTDPGPDFPWGSFLAAVNRHAAAMQSPTPARQEPTLSPAQKFKAALLAACADAKKNVPASRTAVHAGRKVVEAFAMKIK